MAPSSYAAEYIDALKKRSYNTKSFEPVSTPKHYGRASESFHNPVIREQERFFSEDRGVKLAPTSEKRVITHSVLMRSVILLAFIGTILILTVWLGAKATEIQYSINTLKKENVQLEDQITVLGIEAEGAASFESIEEYATKTLKMKYPKSSQCIYIDSNAKADCNLVRVIRAKAYDNN